MPMAEHVKLEFSEVLTPDLMATRIIKLHQKCLKLEYSLVSSQPTNQAANTLEIYSCPLTLFYFFIGLLNSDQVNISIFTLISFVNLKSLIKLLIIDMKPTKYSTLNSAPLKFNINF